MEENKKAAGSAGMRQHTIGIINNIIANKRKNIDALRIILKYMPWKELTEDEESILWSYFLHRSGSL